MKIYINDSTDPYFNLASEQYLLDMDDSGDIFMLWRNGPSVIIGKNQNAYAEINLGFVEENGIKVVRRLTGGGAVFHDLGNVNYTFMTSKKGDGIDFSRFCRPVIDALSALGLDAQMSGRNDIMVGDRKISGNAQCVYNGKTMHHGTLLYSADMSRLSGALNVDEEKIKSKGIKSVRSRVANIKDLIPDTDMDAPGFMGFLEEYFSHGNEIVRFSDGDKRAIQKLSDEKYSSWDWNFGRSKEYQIGRKKYFEYGLVEIHMSVNGGVITEIALRGDYFGVKDISELESALVGCRFIREEAEPLLCGIDRYIMGAEPQDILNLIFN